MRYCEGIVTAQNGLLLQEATLASGQVVVENGSWCNEGFILEAQAVGGELRVGTQSGVIGRLGEFDAMRRSQGRTRIRSELGYPQIRQATLAFEKNEMRGKGEHG